MAHYAFINNENLVVKVLTGIDEDIIQTDTDGTQVGGSTEAWEIFYQNQPWNEGLICKRTSYNALYGDIVDSNTRIVKGNNAFRKNFAQPGFTYDESLDGFIPPKPTDIPNSWTFSPEKCYWVASKPYPADGKFYGWDETILDWVERDIDQIT